VLFLYNKLNTKNQLKALEQERLKDMRWMQLQREHMEEEIRKKYDTLYVPHDTLRSDTSTMQAAATSEQQASVSRNPLTTDGEWEGRERSQPRGKEVSPEAPSSSHTSFSDATMVPPPPSFSSSSSSSSSRQREGEGFDVHATYYDVDHYNRTQDGKVTPSVPNPSASNQSTTVNDHDVLLSTSSEVVVKSLTPNLNDTFRLSKNQPMLVKQQGRGDRGGGTMVGNEMVVETVVGTEEIKHKNYQNKHEHMNQDINHGSEKKKKKDDEEEITHDLNVSATLSIPSATPPPLKSCLKDSLHPTLELGATTTATNKHISFHRKEKEVVSYVDDEPVSLGLGLV
jgi:hypothetical protein